MAFAPVKGERPEWVVQKLTELGIDRIVPLRSERSVVRWTGARGQASVERLRRVAREAAAQCRRVWLPEVARWRSPTWPAWATRRGRPGPAERGPADAAQHVVAGGRRGRLEHGRAGAGLPTVGFGLSVLRAETAAVTAGALLASLRTGTVAPVGEST